MRHRRLSSVLALSLLPGLAGCAFHREENPHNDVLVFATHTKLGVDVSAPATSATLPAFNVGYNRSEAVWMPLRPNGLPGTELPEDLNKDVIARLQQCDARLQPVIKDDRQRNNACLAAILPSDKYVSMSSGVSNTVGGTGIEIDTYSVFASFGARGGVSGQGANGGLAQVFATGIAAQRLASNPQVGNALNTAAPGAAMADANAREAEAETRALELGISPGRADAIRSEALNYQTFRADMADLIAQASASDWLARFDRFKSQAGVQYLCANQNGCANAFRNRTPLAEEYRKPATREKLTNAKDNWNKPLEAS